MPEFNLELNQLPASHELLDFYRGRLDAADAELCSALAQIDALKVSHAEAHAQGWELQKRSLEVAQLQQALHDFQAAVYSERTRCVQLVAENDALKIQEVKDRKKIRFLLSISGPDAAPDEVTYFRDRLDKRLVTISRSTPPGPDAQLADQVPACCFVLLT
jgi:coiled-coil domain-containing protein 77